MRAARAADYRRRAYTRPYDYSLDAIDFTDVPSIGSGSIEFEGGPSFICGGNGVGKSSLLHGIFLALGGTPDTLPPRSLRRLEGGAFSARVTTPTGSRLISAQVTDGNVHWTGEPLACDVQLVDAGPRCHRWLEVLSDMTNFGELLEAIEPAESTDNELQEVRYLTGKHYDSRGVYEIDEFDEVIPYPCVTIGAVHYAFEDMGLGELALNVLYWHLTHASRGSILLLEEPETFVSPRSQRCLVDLICKYAVERELCMVISTHSLGIAGSIGVEHVTLVHGGEPSIGTVRPPRPHQLNDVLGVPQSPKGLVLTEDQAAKAFAKSVIDRLDRDLSFLIEIRSAGDANSISECLRHLPTTDAVTLVGVYDADFPLPDFDAPWGFTQLPGTGAPEVELRDAARASVPELSAAVSIAQAEVAVAVASVEGSDPHDWLTGLAERLGIEHDRLVDALVAVWLLDEDRRDSGAEFVARIRELVG